LGYRLLPGKLGGPRPGPLKFFRRGSIYIDKDAVIGQGAFGQGASCPALMIRALHGGGASARLVGR